MPSPSLVPDDRLLDADHLDRVTLGDVRLQREILALFVHQAEAILVQLARLPSETGALAHTLKGSARGIGALLVAECAQHLETVAGRGRARAEALAELRDVVATTIEAIEARMRPA